METNLIHQLNHSFEGHAQYTENGVEYWLARDLQLLLGYAEWRNFYQSAISKAKIACEVAGQSIADHFVEVNKLVIIGSGTQREIEDVKKVERRLTSDEKKALKNPESLEGE